jgi:hypothetical protein
LGGSAEGRERKQRILGVKRIKVHYIHKIA